MPQFGLEFLQEKDIENNGNARLGLLHTAHGDVHTPCFMPVGTVAAMKAMHFDQLKETGAEIMLCNTYHLMIQDRYNTIYKMGGLHKFMNWNKPILTDYQHLDALNDKSRLIALFSLVWINYTVQAYKTSP